MEEVLHLAPIAMLLVATTISGLLCARLKQPPLVGYILAGAVLGPSGLGLIGDREAIDLLAELGVLVLLFGVGTHLSLRGFRTVWKTALATTLIQVGLSVGALYVVGLFYDWSLGKIVLLAFVLSLSSTAVGIKMLEDVGELRTDVGRCAVGVLIAQDLAIAPMLIVIRGMAGEGGIGLAILPPLALSVVVLGGFIWLLSRRQRLHLPFYRLIDRYPDLAPVLGLCLCIVAAAATALLGLSAGLGAFLAGLYIGNTVERASMVPQIEPIQNLLLMVFFLSVGLLIDLDYVLSHLGIVAILVGAVFVFNTSVNVFALRLSGETWQVSILAGFSLGQIGEFSFLLAAAGAGYGLLDEEAQKMTIAVIAATLLLSPLWLEGARRTHEIGKHAPDSGRVLLRLLARREWRQLRRSLRLARARPASRTPAAGGSAPAAPPERP